MPDFIIGVQHDSSRLYVTKITTADGDTFTVDTYYAAPDNAANSVDWVDQGSQCRKVALTPSGATIVAVGFKDPSDNTLHKAFVSTDYGATFNVIDDAVLAAFFSTNKDLAGLSAYTSVHYLNGFFYIHYPYTNNIFRSADGISWENLGVSPGFSSPKWSSTYQGIRRSSVVNDTAVVFYNFKWVESAGVAETPICYTTDFMNVYPLLDASQSLSWPISSTQLTVSGSGYDSASSTYVIPNYTWSGPGSSALTFISDISTLNASGVFTHCAFFSNSLFFGFKQPFGSNNIERSSDFGVSSTTVQTDGFIPSTYSMETTFNYSDPAYIKNEYVAFGLTPSTNSPDSRTTYSCGYFTATDESRTIISDTQFANIDGWAITANFGVIKCGVTWVDAVNAQILG